MASTTPPSEPSPRPAAPRWRGAGRTGAWIALALVGVALAVRLGPLTAPGRGFLEARLDGAKVGRLGHLRVRGLEGDVWRAFTIRSLAIADRQGVWLQARDVSVRWQWPDLLQRRLHVRALAVGSVVVLRSPSLGPPEPSGASAVSIAIDQARLRLTTEPGFSMARGDFDLTGDLALDRRGPARGSVRLVSRLRPGDFLQARFDVRKATAFWAQARANEARGGAIAGSLGLAADQPFSLSVDATGTPGAGRFRIMARSGEATPVAASGAWDRQGGEGRGRIELTDSRLLAPYRALIGPASSFAFGARRSSGGLYAVAVQVAAENLSASAHGLVDPSGLATGPGGVAVFAQTADAGRLLGGVNVGPGAARLGLGGEVAQWVLSGRVTLQRASIGDYGLARLDGPVRLVGGHGGVAFDLAATGGGGAGRSLLAALLGARPAAAAQGNLLADGRLLVRNLSVQGPGLKLAASGERGLLGGLSFKGDARFANLAFAHPGASGAVTANRRATQSGAGRPWTFALNGQGAHLAVGYAEADRLLGRAPRLSAAGQVQGGRVALTQARLEGAAAQFDASGLIGFDGVLALELGWTAHGPFDVGPLQIAGAASGAGAMTGALGSPRVDLTADFASIAVPGLTLERAHATASFGGDASRPGGGRITLAATSPYGPARAATDFVLATGGVDLTDLSLDAGGIKASGSLGLRSGAPSSADLAFAVGPGAFLTAGQGAGAAQIVDRGGSLDARLSLSGKDLVFRASGQAVRSIKVTAAGPLDDLPFQGEAQGGPADRAWRVGGTGRFTRRGEDAQVSFDGQGAWGRATLRTLAPLEIAFAPGAVTARSRLAIGDGGSADIDVRSAAGGMQAGVKVAGVSLSLIDEGLSGRFDGTVGLSGRAASLAGVLDARFTGLGERDDPAVAPVDGELKANLTGDQAVVDLSMANAAGLKASGRITLPAQATAAPFRIALDRRRPIGGRFDMSGEIGPLWTLLMGPDRELTGRASVAARLAGTLADPRAVGEADLQDGGFLDAQTGLKMRHVGLAARLADNAVDVTRFSAADAAGGQMTGSGRVSLARDGLSSFRLELKTFRLIDNETAKADASGEATINRAADGRVRLAGTLTIDHALISPNPPVPSGVVAMDVVEIHRPLDRPAPAAGPAAPSPVALDVAFKAPRGLFVKGRGLNVELSLDAHVGGTTADPEPTGTAHIVRGDYDFAGKRFEFDDRGVVRLGSSADTIRLDLTATRDDPSLTAVIKISGTAAKPKIALTSTPALPTDEVLSQVLFGASAARLSGLEAAQLASALSGLAGGGGFDVMGGLGKLAHLDTLAFGQTATAGSTISGGKYLKDNVYIELTGGARDGSAAQVEWRARKNLSIISRLGGQGDSQLSVSWRRDF